jgi:hypothetical protein
MVYTFSWLWFVLSLGYGLEFLFGLWLFFLGALSLEKGALALVGYWSTTRIIFFIKVKVLGGGLCSYGWVTILLYYLWKNEHILLFLTNIKYIHLRVQEHLKKIQYLYKSKHDQHKEDHKFHVGENVWFCLYKEQLQGASKKLNPLRYGTF